MLAASIVDICWDLCRHASALTPKGLLPRQASGLIDGKANIREDCSKDYYWRSMQAAPELVDRTFESDILECRILESDIWKALEPC